MDVRTTRIIGWLATYLVAGVITVALEPGGGPSAWSISTAVGVGLLLRNGFRWWPAILVLQLGVTAFEYGSGPVSTLALAAATTVEELVGAWLVRRTDLRLDAAEDVLGLGVVATVTAAVGASLGLAVHLAVGPVVDAPQLWLTWWAADVTAFATILPLVLLAIMKDRDLPRMIDIEGRWLEASAILAASGVLVGLAVAMALASPDHRASFRFLVVLPALWAAVRFGRLPTAISVVVTALAAFAAPMLVDIHFDALDRVSVQGTMIATSLIGQAVAVILIGRRHAIEDLEQTLAALDASERRYTVVFEDSPAIQLLVDPGTSVIVDANHAAAQFYGWSRSDLRTMRVADLTVGATDEARSPAMDAGAEEVTDVAPAVTAVAADPTGAEHGTVAVHRLASGELRDVALHTGAVVIDGRTLMHWSVHDVSARVAAQAEVARLASVVESAADAIVTTDLDDRITGWNPAAAALYGFERQEVVGQPIADRLGPIPLSHADLLDVIRRGSSVRLGHVVRHAATGAQIPVDLSIGPIFDRGTVVGMSRIAHDVRDRIREEERLRRGQALLADAAAIGRIGSWELDPLTGSVTWADELYRIAGMEPGMSVDARTLAELAHPEDRELVDAALARRAEGNSGITFRLLGRDGVERSVLMAWRHVPGAHGGGREVGVVRDATEERQLEARLRQVQRLESIGMLAGGVAHDFNNLLTAIGGFADLAIAAVADGESPDAELAQIQSAVDRARSLTSQLLAFGRRAIVTPQPVDLARAVEALVPILRRVLGERIVILSELKPGAVALIDPGQLDQVVVNLAVNARDAMPDGGTLRIAVGAGDCRRARAADQREPPEPAGRDVAADGTPATCAWIEVEDDGTGIPADVLDQIFLPFFTTKQRGHGTGLGLATVQGIVAQADGTITVRSRPGEGAAFRIELPAVPAVPVSEPVPARREAHGTASGLVLLVEDEDLVRRVGERVLARAGFTVVTATNVPDALKLADRERPDILVTDVVLPGVGDGIALAETLRERWPDLPVVITTGYTEQAPPRWATLLTKPFDLDALASAVRTLVEAARGVDTRP